MRKQTLLWILALPLYYLINAFRHEMAHAFAAFLEGGLITGFRILPTFAVGSPPDWGGATWQGGTSWLTIAMPYLVDLLTYIVFFYICMAVPFQRRWIWLNLVAIGMLSPLLNSGITYFFLGGDVRNLLDMLSPAIVNIFFIAVLAFYLVGLFLVGFFSRTILPSIPASVSQDPG